MRKILLIILTLFSFITFSKRLYDGNYRVMLSKDNKVYEMNIIVKNNSVLSTSFDIKNIEGRSLIFGNIEVMEEKRSIEKRLKNTINIEYIYIGNNEDTENIKMLYYYLIEKSENNEQGWFILK